MRITCLIAAALWLTIGLAGCTKRTHEDVQRELTEAAETLADAYAAGDEAAIDEAVEKHKELSAEAKELGDPPPKTRQRLQAKFGERQRKAAEKLAAAASSRKAAPE